MAGYNKIVMVGNLTRDPEYKQLSSGQALCRLGLATNRQYKNRQTGSMVQEVCYVDIDVWGAQAESCRQYLQKGRSVLIEGRLKFDSWKDTEGQTRSKHCIVAERVVFLSAPAATMSEQDVSTDVDEKLDPRNALEKDILDQLDSIKSKKAQVHVQEVQGAKKAHKQQATAESLSDNQASMGEVALSDEQPFDDELPF